MLHLGRVRRLLQKQVVQKTQHLRELSEDGTSHWLLLVRLLGSENNDKGFYPVAAASVCGT